MKVLSFLFKNGITPSILIAVWVFNLRPFTLIIEKLNTVLKKPLLEEGELSLAAYGAIDIAILTFLLNILIALVSKYFKKPITVIANIYDSTNDQNSKTIKFYEEAEKASPSYLKIKIEVNISHAFYWICNNIFRGVRITVHWHSRWLSVTPQFRDPRKMITIIEEPGNLSFNILEAMSDSDKSAKIDGKLLVLLNSGAKRDGLIDVKVEVNSKNSVVRAIFNGLFNSWFIKSTVNPCKIFLERGK
jgi:hypothetical protein